MTLEQLREYFEVMHDGKWGSDPHDLWDGDEGYTDPIIDARFQGWCAGREYFG